MWNNPPGGAKRGEGRGREKSAKEGKREGSPYRLSPPPLFFPFLPIPYLFRRLFRGLHVEPQTAGYIMWRLIFCPWGADVRPRETSPAAKSVWENYCVIVVGKLVRWSENWSLYRRNCVVDQSRGADRVWRLSVDHRKFTRIDVDEFFSVE